MKVYVVYTIDNILKEATIDSVFISRSEAEELQSDLNYENLGDDSFECFITEKELKE
jgi:hypothetical protein